MQTKRVLTLLALACLSAVSSVRAEDAAKACDSNSDCSDGAWCVAGDSDTAVQRCVAGPPCGGARIGSCPADPATGQLACIWRPDTKACNKASAGCKEIGGELGIYKCISLDRCDKYFGNAQCSGNCNVQNGSQCNGRGNCQVAYDGDKPSFQCACDSGWNGTKCETVVDDMCVVDTGMCGTNGKCVQNACKCSGGFTGAQCEISPAKSGSGSLGDAVGKNNSKDNSTSTTVVPTKLTPNTAGSAASNGDTLTGKKKGHKSTVFIVVGLLAALIIVAALLFALYSRKKKREQESAGAGAAFGRAGSVDEGVAAGGPDTPKQNIVIM